MPINVKTAPKRKVNCASNAGQVGTNFRQIRDTSVPATGPSNPGESRASSPVIATASVPILSKGSEGLSHNKNEPPLPVLKASFDASDHTDQSLLNSDYEAQKAACIALCDRVAKEELPRMVLRNTYRGTENSHRDML